MSVRRIGALFYSPNSWGVRQRQCIQQWPKVHTLVAVNEIQMRAQLDALRKSFKITPQDTMFVSLISHWEMLRFARSLGCHGAIIIDDMHVYPGWPAKIPIDQKGGSDLFRIPSLEFLPHVVHAD